MATVFRLNLSELAEEDFFRFVDMQIASRDPCYVVTPNLHFARLAQADESFRAALESAKLRLCDSAVLFAILALKGRPLPARLTGSDLTPKLLRAACDKGWRVFLFGSDAATLEKVRSCFPNVVCGVASPPIHDQPWTLHSFNERCLEEIRHQKPDILFIALGVRKQEYWAQKYSARSGVPIVMCVGASLDFVGGRIRRSPQFLSRIGLEWLWRLSVEPVRLWRRYAGDAAFILRHGLAELRR